MPGNNQTQQGAAPSAVSPDQTDAQVRELRTHLNKHILKLVFSYLGRDGTLDDTIREFKSTFQKTRNDDDRDKLIENVIAEILKFSDEQELSSKQTEAGDELFVEFLNKLSITHDNADEIVTMRNRLRDIREEQDKLSVINDTIKLLASDTPGRGFDAQEFILNLIDHVELPEETATRLEKIKQQIYRDGDQADMDRVLRDITGVINDANKKLQGEFQDIRRYISQVVGQLGQLNDYLTGSIRDHRMSYNESRKLNEDVIKRNESLRIKIDSGSNLEEIKQCVNLHIETVNQNLKARLESESKSHVKVDRQMQAMQRELRGTKQQCDALKEKLHKARQKALHDALTGLPNRLAFDDRLADELVRYERYQHPLTLAVLDIDHFKRVNDTYGHKAGDKVLKAMAEVCSDHIRQSDFIARFGGEEFVMLLPNTGLRDALNAMDKLRAVIEDCHFHYNEQTVPITVSIGLAEFRPEDDPDTVFQRADAALYAAKDSGRNRCQTGEQLDPAA